MFGVRITWTHAGYGNQRLYDPELRLEPDTILRFSEQLLDAIAFVHKAGYGHGGTTSHEMLADAATIFPLFPAADVWQMLAAETFALHVVVCRR